ncbi:ravA [Symbiodinium microadriaticum]|nr:ravA [Symbiodinium microadriaticum]
MKTAGLFRYQELALGEYTMPVLGMLSVFDWSEMGDKEKTWSGCDPSAVPPGRTPVPCPRAAMDFCMIWDLGREWFVVKKAEVRMAEDQTLIPHVRMGVEAREQIVTPKGLEELPQPCFPVISEFASRGLQMVSCQLKQDAPVTVPTHPLKKFAEAFTRNFDLIAERKSVIFHLRELAKASVMAKYLVDSKARIDPSWYRLADEIVKGAPPEPHMEIPQLWNMRGNSRIKLKNGRLIDMVTGGQSKLQAIYGGVESLRGTQRPFLGRPMFMPQRFQLGQREMPQGVDLNLDKFSLSTEERFRGRLPPCSGDAKSLEGRTTLGKAPLAFLSSLRRKSWNGMKMDDQKLLLNIFDVSQCDRTEEGDAFTPPDPNLEYIVKVRSLVGEEWVVLEERGIRDRRRVRFADKNFVMAAWTANPGNEFPRSWTSRFQVENEGRISYTAPTKFGWVKLDVDENFKHSLLEDEFDQVTEDGVAFRIYKLGSLEVRTIQEVEEPEMVHVVFSSRAVSWETKGSKTQDVLGKETLSRCRVYVEAMEHEDRNSLAKLLFTADCKEGLRMCDVRKHFEAQPRDTDGEHRKRYAKALYVFTTGRSLKGKWGGSARRYTAPPMRGLGVQALGRSSEFMNVAWPASDVARQELWAPGSLSHPPASRNDGRSEHRPDVLGPRIIWPLSRPRRETAGDCAGPLAVAASVSWASPHFCKRSGWRRRSTRSTLARFAWSEATEQKINAVAQQKIESWLAADPEVPEVSALAERISTAVADLEEGLIERSLEVRILLLAAFCAEHVLLLGPPGTAKSLLARRLTRFVGTDAVFFERLLTRFSVPEELFGPLSLKSLERDEYVRKTTGYLPEASVAFVDEIFKANSAILNTLLSLVNERVFDNGPERVAVPLQCLVAASNEAPESEELEALYDRLLFRLLVKPVSDVRVPDLVKATCLKPPGAAGDAKTGSFAVGLEDAQHAQELAGTVKVGPKVVEVLVDCRRFFAKLQPAVQLSDRRLGQSVRMMQVAAWTCGRSEVELCDCVLLGHVFWSSPEHCEQFQAYLRGRLARTRRRQLSSILGGLLERVESGATSAEDLLRELEAFRRAITQEICSFERQRCLAKSHPWLAIEETAAWDALLATALEGLRTLLYDVAALSAAAELGGDVPVEWLRLCQGRGQRWTGTGDGDREDDDVDETFTVGKHKGRLFSEVATEDEDYCRMATTRLAAEVQRKVSEGSFSGESILDKQVTAFVAYLKLQRHV